MSKASLLVLLTLALLPVAALHATPPAAVKKPLPPLVQKFVAAVQNAQTLSVDAVQVVPPGSIAENAHLVFTKPNKMKLTVRIGTQQVGTVVSDGQTVYDWNTGKYETQPAPSTLAQYSSHLMVMTGSQLTRFLFIDPAPFVSGLKLTDEGAVILHGVPARKMVSLPTPNVLTIWFAQSTGLPLQASVDTPSHTSTYAFKNIQLNKPVAASVFSARPPKNLTAFAPPSRPAQPELLAPGSPAPDFTLPSPNGKPVTLSSLKGQVVLIDFWATWCGPCMMAMPHIQALHKELGGKGLKVLSVNTSDTQPAMTKFLKTHKEYTTTMLFDGVSPSVSSAKYKVSGIPTVYLIDKDGNVAASFVGYDPQGETAIKAALAKLGVE